MNYEKLTNFILIYTKKIINNYNFSPSVSQYHLNPFE